MSHLISLHLALTLVAAPAASTVTPFRTEAAPRVDAVFGDAATLRKSVDQFLALHTEMENVRDAFSTAVHETLAQLAPPLPVAPTSAKTKGRAATACPPGAGTHYHRALAAGSRYLNLGRRLETRFREIRRADELGDAVGLTPDYRAKTKHAHELYVALLHDFRDMHLAFYDQLGAEMRHAGCATAAAPANAGPGDNDDADPSDPTAWQLEPLPAPTTDAPPKAAAGLTGPAIWIDIDNSHCAQPSRLSIDGTPLGRVAGLKKLAVRTHAGPRELCVLPSSDKRNCGEPGTIRRAYLYEGWTLTVRCEK